jgi:hypothetical protein
MQKLTMNQVQKKKKKHTHTHVTHTHSCQSLLMEKKRRDIKKRHHFGSSSKARRQSSHYLLDAWVATLSVVPAVHTPLAATLKAEAVLVGALGSSATRPLLACTFRQRSGQGRG